MLLARMPNVLWECTRIDWVSCARFAMDHELLPFPRVIAMARPLLVQTNLNTLRQLLRISRLLVDNSFVTATMWTYVVNALTSN
jgi:hypothetical protein